MGDVTDADRTRAFRALGWHESWGLDDLSDSDRNEVEDIAAALAEERAKARAPFLVRARECELQAEVHDKLGNRETARAFRVCVQRIRRAAEETQ